MPLKILHHKSFHVYNAENIARVKRDEHNASLASDEADRRMSLADSEARLDRMRRKTKRSRARDDDPGELELERQLKGKSRRESSDPTTAREEESTLGEGGTRIIRSEKGKDRQLEPPSATSGHVNFWAEFEAGAKPTGVNMEAKLEKAIEKEQMDSLTKMYLAKKGEGEPTGWYATKDGKTERERKEGVEATLERAYKDGEHKRLADPLALMNSFLKRRSDVLSSAATTSRWRTPGTPDTDRGDLSPVVTSLLPPRRRRGDPTPPPVSSSSIAMDTIRPSTATARDPYAEAQNRVTSERARAQALIAAKKRLLAGSSIASDTPRTDVGDAGYGMYNRNETKAAKEKREAMYSHDRGYSSYTTSRDGPSSRQDDRNRDTEGWGERKARRNEKERRR